MVDTSGSMKGLRMTIAKHTVSTILDTLGENDFQEHHRSKHAPVPRNTSTCTRVTCTYGHSTPSPGAGGASHPVGWASRGPKFLRSRGKCVWPFSEAAALLGLSDESGV